MYFGRQYAAPLAREPTSPCCTKDCMDCSRVKPMRPVPGIMCLSNDMIRNPTISGVFATMRYNAFLHSPAAHRKDFVSHLLRGRLDSRLVSIQHQHAERELAWELEQRRGIIALGNEKQNQKLQQKYRTTFSMEQVGRLEEEFRRQQYIVAKDRRLLSKEIGISELQVKVWFQNRRIKWRKQQLERQGVKCHETYTTEVSNEKPVTKTEEE